MLGAKRRNTGPVAMDTNDVTNGGTNQYSKRRLTAGHKMGRSKRMRKLLRAETSSVIFKLTAIAPNSGSTGMFRMWNTVNTTTPGSNSWRVPVHCYDLTCVNNFVSPTRGFCLVGRELQLNENAAAPYVQWNAIKASDYTGGNYGVGNWNVEETGDHTGVSVGSLTNIGPKSLHDWVDIRMMLYSMTGTFTRYKIQIVQFFDESFVPGGPKPGTSASPPYLADDDPVYNPEVYRWWQEYLRPWVYSPIITGTNRTKQFKVLKSYSVSLNPRLTTAGDNNSPGMHELKMFVRLNRLNKYQWENIGSVAAGQISEDTLNPIDSAGTDTYPFLHPKARIFLMIQANPLLASGNATIPNYATVGTANAVSYDIQIRSKHSALNT